MDIIIAGITACLAMDIFQRFLLITTGQPPSNWAVVGRWAFNVLRTARLYQPDIESTDEIKGEHALAGLSIMQSALAMLLFMLNSCKRPVNCQFI